MRSCIYCGRELEKGEICSCPQSAAFRAAKTNQAQDSQSYSQTGSSYREGESRTSYHTGYTAKEGRIKHAWNRGKAKWHAAKSERSGKDFAKGFGNVIWESVKAPVTAIENARAMNTASILVLAALQGAAMWLCMYFITTNVRRGPLAMLASLMAINGMEGYHNIAHMLMVVVSGALSGIILFFLYTGIFFLINRFLFKNNSKYWDFSQRLVLAGIPFIIVGVFGIFFSMISSTTLLILLLCGWVGWVTLTYEALKAEWYSKTPDKVAYAMLLGLFVFFTIVCYLIRLS